MHYYFIIILLSPPLYSIVVRFPVTVLVLIRSRSSPSSSVIDFSSFLFPSLTEWGLTGTLLCMKLPDIPYLQKFLFVRNREVSFPYYSFH